MEREKMIEEIAKKVCIACGKCKELKGDCYLARNVASVMIDDGYQKVTDGAVVLTKEELEKMDNRKNYGDVVDTLFFRIRVLKREHENRLEQIRKDTAREIYENFVKGYFRWDEEEFEDSFKEFIVKEYGVEVEE